MIILWLTRCSDDLMYHLFSLLSMHFIVGRLMVLNYLFDSVRTLCHDEFIGYLLTYLLTYLY